MNKSFITLLVLSLLIAFGFGSKSVAQQNQPTNIELNTTPEALCSLVDILTLSHSEVFIPCKIGYVPTESCPDNTIINVATRGAIGPDGEKSEIKYTVSGGHIIGQGEEVKWDLSDVKKSGVYTLTVDFVDWNGEKQNKTETVTVKDCDCPNDEPILPQISKLKIKKSAQIEKIELDKNEIVYICPYSDFCGKDENFSIKVKTRVRNPKNKPILYQYTVSGGRIVGQGENVIWDLKNSRPGEYTITVAIDSGRGFNTETKTEKVSVKECPMCDLPCFCLNMDTSVSASTNMVKAGETLTFTAQIKSKPTFKIFYSWTISQGEIIEGQGTSIIKVKTTREMAGTNLTATIEIIAGGICSACEPPIAETILIIK